MNKRRGFLSIGALLAIIFAFFSLNAIGASATSNKVTICHATSSESNPWERLVVDDNATAGHFEESGTPLSGHEDDILLSGDVPCPTEEESLASATFTLECFAEQAQLVANVAVSGPVPDAFLTLVTTSGSLDPDVQDINWVTRSYAVLSASAFGADVGDSLTASLVLGSTTVDSQTFTVPDCSPEVTTTTQPAPTTTVPTTPTTVPVVTTTPPVVTTVAPPTKLPITGLPSVVPIGAGILIFVGGTLLLIRRRDWSKLGI